MDEGSEIRQRMREHASDLKVLKPAMGTDPHVYYLGLPDAFVDHMTVALEGEC